MSSKHWKIRCTTFSINFFKICLNFKYNVTRQRNLMTCFILSSLDDHTLKKMLVLDKLKKKVTLLLLNLVAAVTGFVKSNGF